ncbi:MAG: hypothetical protein HQM12_23175 [SAR324 cluster bacterium]|nr:hypothetical protein [SAR324 cluster bacterium]
MGITSGSLYKLSISNSYDSGDIPQLTISHVNTYESKGEIIQGSMKVGDLLEEIQHAYPYEPLKVWVDVQFPEQDASLIEPFKKILREIPGYTLASTPADVQLIVRVLRPKRIQGQVQFNNNGNMKYTEPDSDPSQPPEIWILKPDETLYQENLVIDSQDKKRREVILTENLKKLIKIKSLKLLGSKGPSENIGRSVELKTFRVEKVESCPLNNTSATSVVQDCITFDSESYKKISMEKGSSFTEQTYQKNSLVSFSLINQSNKDYYTYLLDLMPNGHIEPLFPLIEENQETALIKKGNSIDLFERGTILELSDIGEETIKLIISKNPVDIRLFAQDEYKSRGVKNPLEEIISQTMSGNSRGKPIKLAINEWGTFQISVNVVNQVASP